MRSEEPVLICRGAARTAWNLLASSIGEEQTMMSVHYPRIIAVIALLLVAASRLVAQQPKATAEAALSADEKQIRQAVIAFAERYNAHKAADVAALFAPDARVVYRDGSEANGREEIKQGFEEVFRESPKAAIS